MDLGLRFKCRVSPFYEYSTKALSHWVNFNNVLVHLMGPHEFTVSMFYPFLLQGQESETGKLVQNTNFQIFPKSPAFELVVSSKYFQEINVACQREHYW